MPEKVINQLILNFKSLLAINQHSLFYKNASLYLHQLDEKNISDFF